MTWLDGDKSEGEILVDDCKKDNYIIREKSVNSLEGPVMIFWIKKKIIKMHVKNRWGEFPYHADFKDLDQFYYFSFELGLHD